MSRRHFLQLLGGSALTAGCAPSLPAQTRRAAARASAGSRPIGAVAFDLFTIFDPRGVDRRVESVTFGNKALAATWKTRLFEYCWLRAAAGKYADFAELLRDSLDYAARAHAVALTAAQREQLESAFTELEPWPDSLAVLAELRARGLRLAPLANYSPQMLESLLTHAKLRQNFTELVSTDQARTYKPDPRAYALAEKTFGLPRQQIAFAAFGGWDAAGARWFGLPTFWVNRLANPSDILVAPDASGPDLSALLNWVTNR